MIDDDSQAALKLRLRQAYLRSLLIELTGALNSHQLAIGMLIIDDRAGAAKELSLAGDAITAAAEQIGKLIEVDGS